jgi:hypothetical protein
MQLLGAAETGAKAVFACISPLAVQVSGNFHLTSVSTHS